MFRQTSEEEFSWFNDILFRKRNRRTFQQQELQARQVATLVKDDIQQHTSALQDGCP